MIKLLLLVILIIYLLYKEKQIFNNIIRENFLSNDNLKLDCINCCK